MNPAKILVVGEGLTTNQRLRDELESAQYRCSGIAHSAEEAFELARADCPDVAIVDAALAPAPHAEALADLLIDAFDIPVLLAISGAGQCPWRTSGRSPSAYLTQFDSLGLERTVEIAREHHALLKKLRVTEAELATLRPRAEQMVLDGESVYRSVVEGQTEVISRFTANGTFTFVNDVYCRFFGKDAEELIGQSSWHPVSHPDDQEAVAKKLKELTPSDPVVVIENRVYSAKGELRWMQFVNQAFFDSTGRLIEIQSVGRDISDRKQIEHALREAEAFKRAILDAVSTQVTVLDQFGTIIEVNEAWKRFARDNSSVVGQPSRRTGIGTNYLEICRTAAGSCTEGAMEVAQGIRSVLDGTLESFGYEYPCHAPGVQRWFHMTVTPLRGTHGGVVISHSDISAPRMLAEELRESEQNLARAQSLAHIGSWRIDLCSLCSQLSEETHRIFGIPLGSPATLEDLFERVHPDDKEVGRSAWLAALSHRVPYDIEYRICVAGVVKWVHANAELRFGEDGRPVAAFGYVQDITERKHAELALRQSEARSRSILRAAPLGIGVTRELVFQEVNDAMTVMTGYSAEQLIGQSSRMLYLSSGDFDLMVQQKYDQLRKNGLATVETRWRQKDDTVIHVALNWSPIDDADFSKGITFTAEDVSAFKMAEEERLVHEARQREALVHEVHHRIKNNLQGVIGLLREHVADAPDARTVIQAAIAQVNTIAVVHGLQSRIPHNELRMRELLHEIAGAATALAAVPWLPVIDDQLCGDVCLDGNVVVPIALILNELIQNALKHCLPTDGSDVHVMLSGGAEEVTVRIRNAGTLDAEEPDLNTGKGCNTGLKLVRLLLPRRGARVNLRQSEGYVETELVLNKPVTANLGLPINLSAGIIHADFPPDQSLSQYLVSRG
jgi:PAS domain S-box-containing protein